MRTWRVRFADGGLAAPADRRHCGTQRLPARGNPLFSARVRERCCTGDRARGRCPDR
ncbi:hypothetical protein [Streptomyces sp. NPDC051569]|uniref:hypothetical protein n=1 Tax=Streptomyces sp. NPDC051569 TaxID=3365661 RepID=UPI00378B3172